MERQTGEDGAMVGKHKVTLVHPKRTETFDLVIDGKSVPELMFNANN
jgi:hypothetical protein